MKLKEFYKNTVELNDSMNGGWAKYYYGVFSKIIKDNNYKIVAEVGIGYGTHAKYILKNNDDVFLYLIDPTKYYQNDGFANDIMNQEPEISGNNFNELFDLINQELSPWKDRFTWFRTESLSINNDQIPDESLDCIFIDGDHSYQAVSKDLEFWWKKIKPGGQLLGDDYWMSDVSKAVHEFNEKNKPISLDFLTNETCEYKIYRFMKSLSNLL